MANIADLVVTLTTETAAFRKGLESASGELNKFRSGIERQFAQIRSAGALFVGAMVFDQVRESIARVVEEGDKLNKLSQSTGVAVEALSALQYAAKLSDLETEELAIGLTRLSKAAAAAAQSGQDGAIAVGQYRVAVRGANKELRPTEDILADIAERFKAMPDSYAKTAIAIEIFGKSGAKLIPLLNQGKDGLAKLREEAERAGVVFSTKAAQQSEEFNDNLERLSQSAKGFTNTLVREMIPGLQQLSEILVKIANTRASKEFAKGLPYGLLPPGLGQALQTYAKYQELTKKDQQNAATTGGTSALPEIPYDDAVKELKSLNDKVADANLTSLQKVNKQWQDHIDRIRFLFSQYPQLRQQFGDLEVLATKAKQNAAKEASAKIQGELASARDALLSIEAQIAQGTGDNVAKINAEWDKHITKIEEVMSKYPELAKEFNVRAPGFGPSFVEQANWARFIELFREGARDAGELQKKLVEIVNLVPVAPANEANVLPANIGAAKIEEFKGDPKAQKDFILGTWEQTQTAAQRVAFEMTKLNVAFKEGKINPELYAAALGNLKLQLDEAHESEVRLQRDLLMRTKEASAGAKVFFEDYADYAADAARQIYDVLSNAFRGIEDAFAEMVVEGKNQWGDLFKSIAKDIVKYEFRKNVLGPIANALGLGDAINKPDGTKSNPLNVNVVNGIGGIPGIGGKDGGLLGDILGTSKPDGSKNNPFFVVQTQAPIGGAGFGGLLNGLFSGGGESDSEGESGGGGLLGSIFKLFGGKRASGGPMDAGKWYIAGERGPEPIFMGSSGYALSTDKFAAMVNRQPAVVYQIDARGAAPGVEIAIKRAIKEAENNAVRRAVKAASDAPRRGYR